MPRAPHPPWRCTTVGGGRADHWASIRHWEQWFFWTSAGVVSATGPSTTAASVAGRNPAAMDSPSVLDMRSPVAPQHEHRPSTMLRLRRTRPATIRFTDPGISDYETDLASEVVVCISVRAAAPLDSRGRSPAGGAEPTAHLLPAPGGAAAPPRVPEVEVVLTIFSRHEDTVGSLMISIRSQALPPPLVSRRLRLLHSGRLLADRGVLLVDWLDMLDARRASALAGTAADDFGFESRHLPAWERTVTLAAAPPPESGSCPTGEEEELAPLPPGAGDSVNVAGLRIPLAPLLHAVRPSVLAQHSISPGLGRRNTSLEEAVIRLPLQLPPDPAVLADLDAARAALARLVPQGMLSAWSSPLPYLLPLHTDQADVIFDQVPTDDDEDDAPATPRNKGKARATDTEVTAMTHQDASTPSGGTHVQAASLRPVSSIASDRVYLQCAVGAEDEPTGGSAAPIPPPALEDAGAETASGLDQLVASGALSAEEVERIRRVFLYSRPELLRGRTGDALQAGDEEAHIRALEEQWLSSAGPMGGTGEQGQAPVQTTGPGNASQAWVGMMVGFFFPFVSLFFIADRPHPSFFPTLSSHPRVVESDSESDTEEEEEEDEDEAEDEEIDVEAELPAGAQTHPADSRSETSLDATEPGEPHSHPLPDPSPEESLLAAPEADDEPLSDLAARVTQRRAERAASARVLRRRSEGARPQRRPRPTPLISLEWGGALRDALARGLRARRRAARWEARVTRERARRMAIEVRRRIRGGALVSPSVRSGVFVGIATNVFIAIFRWFFTPPP